MILSRTFMIINRVIFPMAVILVATLSGCGGVDPDSGTTVKNVAEEDLLGNWHVTSIRDKGTEKRTPPGQASATISIDTVFVMPSAQAWTFHFRPDHSLAVHFDTLDINGTWSISHDVLTMLTEISPSAPLDTLTAKLSVSGDSATLISSYDFGETDSTGVTWRDVYDETLHLSRDKAVDSVPVDTARHDSVSEAALLGKWEFSKQRTAGYMTFTPTGGTPVKVDIDTTEFFSVAEDYYIRFDSSHAYQAHFQDSVATTPKRAARAKRSARAALETGTWTLSGNVVTTVSSAGDTTHITAALDGSAATFKVFLNETIPDTGGVYVTSLASTISATKQ